MFAPAVANIGGYVGNFVLREPPRETRHSQRRGARRASADAPAVYPVAGLPPKGAKSFASFRLPSSPAIESARCFFNL
jgi:hypothetical protein